MEKSVIQIQEEKAFSVNVQMIGIAMIGFMIGSINYPIAFALSFFYLAYLYMRDEKECRTVAIAILIGSLICGIFTTYLYALGLTIFFITIHVFLLWNKNMYRILPYISAFVCIPYGLYAYGLQGNALIFPLCVFVLMRMNDQDYTWIQKRFVCTKAMYGVLIATFTYLLLPYLPVAYQPMLIFGGLLTAAFFCDAKVLMVFMVMNYVLFPMYPITIVEIILLAMITLWKHAKIQLLCGLLLYGLVLKVDVEMALLLAFCALLTILYREESLPFHIVKQTNQEPTLSTQSILKRQIQNFSSIFQSLSQYYENISSVQSQMLSEMALALKYSADTLKKLDVQDNQKERILKAMEGYQYDVLNLNVEEAGEGNISYDFDIRNINKGEITHTLLPLMEVLTHEHLKVSNVKHHRFQNGYHHVTLQNHVPYRVDAYADSQKNMYESSGDSFSIFRFRNSMICMISDGMGSGDKAAASSRLITNIFQRMVFSGIPKADSIRCINKLLQSDAYATLDVICFDLSEGKAYIFKSAACPTFLIRNDQLYEVSGSSLPVGIISTMEPDCFVADLEAGDEYIMFSDGVFIDEIYRWIKERKHESAKTDCEALMSILRERKRMDDSTVVLSRIQHS